MADGRVRVRLPRWRFNWGFTPGCMHNVDPLRLSVIRLDVFVANRPGRREAAVMANLTEVEIDRAGIPVVFLPRNIAAALQEQNALAGGSELMGQRPATRAGADNDHIEMI